MRVNVLREERRKVKRSRRSETCSRMVNFLKLKKRGRKTHLMNMLVIVRMIILEESRKRRETLKVRTTFVRDKPKQRKK